MSDDKKLVKAGVDIATAEAFAKAIGRAINENDVDTAQVLSGKLVDEVACGSQSKGWSDADTGEPLRCTLPRGHEGEHKNERTGWSSFSWDDALENKLSVGIGGMIIAGFPNVVLPEGSAGKTVTVKGQTEGDVVTVTALNGRTIDGKDAVKIFGSAVFVNDGVNWRTAVPSPKLANVVDRPPSVATLFEEGKHFAKLRAVFFEKTSTGNPYVGFKLEIVKSRQMATGVEVVHAMPVRTNSMSRIVATQLDRLGIDPNTINGMLDDINIDVVVVVVKRKKKFDGREIVSTWLRKPDDTDRETDFE